MSRPQQMQGEEGAVAILYSVAILMMLGLLAITIDIAALRYDRAHSQTVADMAAAAGALDLHEVVGGSPEKACQQAWEYFLVNSGEEPAPGGEPNCDIFDVPVSPCPSSVGDPAVGRTENYEFRVWWPIPDDSDFLNDEGQTYDPDVDGDDPCSRIAVHVHRTRGFVFGGAVGETQGSTGAPAVARSIVASKNEDVASLVLLDPTACEAVEASGGGGDGGGVWVWEGPEETPGIIVVDSDGSECGGYVIERSGGGGSNAEIKAGVIGSSGADGIVGDNGLIVSHAMQAGACDGCAYDPADVVEAVAPVPIAGPRVTRKPPLHRWNCKDDYDGVTGPPVPHLPVPDCEGTDRVPAGSAYIDALDTYVDQAAADPLLRDSLFDVKTDCSIAGADPATQTWDLSDTDKIGVWVECPGSGFTVSSGYTVHVPEGNVVINGGFTLRGGFLSNAVAGACSDQGADKTSRADDVSHDNWLVVRNGTFIKRASGTHLELGSKDCRGTTVLLQNAPIDLAGGTSTLKWYAPYTGKMERGPDLDLEDLALWSESTAEHALSGGPALDVEGVYYVPNADGGDGFEYAGSGNMGQQKAQFLTYRMWAHGNGKLSMTPDPDRALPTFSFEGVSLIR